MTTLRKRHRQPIFTENDSSTSFHILPDALSISSSAARSSRVPPPTIHVSHGCLLIPVLLAAWWYYTKQYCRSFVRGFLRNRPEHRHYDDQGRQQHSSDGSGHFARMEDAYFQAEWVDETASNGDHTRQNASVLSSNRFVKWINRRNVRRQFEKNKVRKTTHDYLYGRKGQTRTVGTNNINNDASSSPTATAAAQSMLSSDKSLLDTMDTEDDDNPHSAAEGDNNHLRHHSQDREHSFTLDDLPSFESKRPRRENDDEEWECIPRDSHIELCLIPDDFLHEV